MAREPTNSLALSLRVNGLTQTLTPSLTIEGFMRPMNEILVDIALAVGGTVTNPNNRNELLRDWLNAIS